MSAQMLQASQAADATDGAERRAAPRTRTLKRGKILFNNNFSTFDCIVRNISATGALLTLDEAAHLPREFNIRIGEDRTVHLARLVYRRGMFAGIHFLDVETAHDPHPPNRHGEAEEAAARAHLHAEDLALATVEGSIRRIEPEALPTALRRLVPWKRAGA